jgi:hypothetical protein
VPSGHPFSPTHVAKVALTGAFIGLGVLASAGQANAQPVPPLPTPVPGQPLPPGQPVMEVPGSEPIAAPAPPPIGAPVVPEISNPQYGQGSSPGPLGFLRDAWHQAQDPYGFTGTPPGQMPAAAPPPPGAGPAPQLPAGYESLTDPASNGPPTAGTYEGGPPLPEGYYPIDGPPPPGYFDGPPPPPPGAPLPPGPAPRTATNLPPA